MLGSSVGAGLCLWPESLVLGAAPPPHPGECSSEAVSQLTIQSIRAYQAEHATSSGTTVFPETAEKSEYS